MANVSTILKNLYAAKKPTQAQMIGAAHPGSITGDGKLNWTIDGGNTANAAVPTPKPAAPAPAPSSTPGPTTPSGTNPATGMPWDATYESTLAGINRNLAFTQGNLDFDFGKTRSRLGFDAAGNFDPTDPFSRAALLKRSFDQRKDFTTNSMAARGQLYSGAIGRARGEDQHNFDVSSDSLQKVYDDAFQSYVRARTGAGNAAADQGVIAKGEAIARIPPADPLTSPSIYNADGSLNWTIAGGNTSSAAVGTRAPIPKKKK